MSSSLPSTRINWVGVLRAGCLTGTCASLASTAALALAARMEGKAAIRPINAVSRWLNGERAASYEGVDAAHTVVGYVTNHAASIFWAIIFEAWCARRRPVGPLPMLRDAVVMSAIAVVVDYGPTPRRFRPGWELVLSKKGMAIAYTGLAVGLAAGALWTQSGRRSES